MTLCNFDIDLTRAKSEALVDTTTNNNNNNTFINNNNNNNNFISIALLSYVQGALQSLLKNIFKFTTISYYIYNG